MRKNLWQAEEDELLLELVHRHGLEWSLIAESFINRSGKQCRERWTNHLDPSVNRNNWTEEEDALLLELQRVHGNQWSKFSKLFDGRRDNAIKNRFHSLARQQNLSCEATSTGTESEASETSHCGFMDCCKDQFVNLNGVLSLSFPSSNPNSADEDCCDEEEMISSPIDIPGTCLPLYQDRQTMTSIFSKPSFYSISPDRTHLIPTNRLLQIRSAVVSSTPSSSGGDSPDRSASDSSRCDTSSVMENNGKRLRRSSSYTYPIPAFTH